MRGVGHPFLSSLNGILSFSVPCPVPCVRYAGSLGFHLGLEVAALGVLLSVIIRVN